MAFTMATRTWVARNGRPSLSLLLRTLVTDLMEPSAAVLQRPCSVVLAEDRGFYQSSIHVELQEAIVSKYGMTFGYVSLPSISSWEEGIEEISKDIQGIPQPVLVAHLIFLLVTDILFV